MKVIDCHTHIFPGPTQFLEKLREFYPDFLENEKIDLNKVTKWLPEFREAHNLSQAAIRKSYKLPSLLQKASDKYLSASSIYSLISHSCSESLTREMERNDVQAAIVIAHPPLTTNELVLEFSHQMNGKIIPFVNIGFIENPEELLEKYIDQGAKGIKLHHASDGKAAAHPYYERILKVAQDKKLPVIIHTGCFHIKPLHKCPEFSDVGQFKDYFENFPEVQFILAHMNYRHPQACLELLKRYPQVYTDISWQTEQSILEAFEAGLEDQLLFGSDWPIVGNNIEYMKKEFLKLSNQLSSSQVEKLMMGNASRLFNLSVKD